MMISALRRSLLTLALCLPCLSTALAVDAPPTAAEARIEAAALAAQAAVQMGPREIELGDQGVLKLPEGFGGVWMSDDDSVIMSAGIYREFIKPYNEQFLAAFGGGCIHYCGNSTQNIENYVNTRGVTAINNFTLDNLAAAAKIRRALREKGIVYMACDFTPADARLEDYHRELEKAMDGPEGVIMASYIAPAIELDKGKYEPASRDRVALARRVFALMTQNRG